LPGATELVHGTCVALGRSAALLRGPSGSGKSDLALRFLFLARRGPAAASAPALVADDQVCLVADGTRLVAKAPESIRGKLEVRGIGIITVRFLRQADLALIVDLVDKADIERLPERDTLALLGVKLPLLRLAAFEASAPAKLAVALARAAPSRRCG
jgi:serine kinase of HPr protein (carbohydrate metabolism regulator)